MSDIGNVKRLFPGGNTSKGFVSFYDYIIKPDAKRVFIIKGGPGVGKSTFMKKIGLYMINKGYDIELHQCSSDNNSVDGLVIPKLSVALIDGTAPHIVDPKNPGAVDEIINLGDYWDESKIVKYKKEIIYLNEKIKRRFAISYDYLSDAKRAYNEWKSYIEESVEKREYYNTLKASLKEIFCTAKPSFNTNNHRHLFAGAITPEGIVNHIHSLIDKNMKVFALTGSPGSGVKYAIDRVASISSELGLYTEQYHCPFIPNTLDMIIIPDINTVVLNTTKPYHYNCELNNIVPQKVLDVDQFLNTDVLYDYKEYINRAKGRFNDNIESAVTQLSMAKKLHDEMEGFYIPAMDFDAVEKKRLEILDRILSYELSM